VIGKTPLDRKCRKTRSTTINVTLDGFFAVDKTYRLSQDQDEEIPLNPIKKTRYWTPVKKKKDDGIQAFE